MRDQLTTHINAEATEIFIDFCGIQRRINLGLITHKYFFFAEASFFSENWQGLCIHVIRLNTIISLFNDVVSSEQVDPDSAVGILIIGIFNSYNRLYLLLKRQTKIAADDILIFYFYLSKIHLKHQVLFSLENNEKIFLNVVCCISDWRFKG